MELHAGVIIGRNRSLGLRPSLGPTRRMKLRTRRWWHGALRCGWRTTNSGRRRSAWRGSGSGAAGREARGSTPGEGAVPTHTSLMQRLQSGGPGLDAARRQPDTPAVCAAVHPLGLHKARWPNTLAPAPHLEQRVQVAGPLEEGGVRPLPARLEVAPRGARRDGRPLHQGPHGARQPAAPGSCSSRGRGTSRHRSFAGLLSTRGRCSRPHRLRARSSGAGGGRLLQGERCLGPQQRGHQQHQLRRCPGAAVGGALHTQSSQHLAWRRVAAQPRRCDERRPGRNRRVRCRASTVRTKATPGASPGGSRPAVRGRRAPPAAAPPSAVCGPALPGRGGPSA
jgi:hypothetical protein